MPAAAPHQEAAPKASPSAAIVTPRTQRATPVMPASGASPAAPSSPALAHLRRSASSSPELLRHFQRLNRMTSSYAPSKAARFFKLEDLIVAYRAKLFFYSYIQVRRPTKSLLLSFPPPPPPPPPRAVFSCFCSSSHFDRCGR